MAWSPLIQIDVENTSVNDLNARLSDAVLNSARATNMLYTRKNEPRLKDSKPWFDRDCKNRKMAMKSLLAQCKNAGNNSKLWTLYCDQKKMYHKFLKERKMEYGKSIQSKFANARDSKEFWEVVRIARRRTYIPSKISVKDWEAFFQKVYPIRLQLSPDVSTHYHPTLDSEITLEELQDSLKKCKSNKAPGADGISNEFLKNLPDNWLLYSLALFNKIMSTESIPLDWACIITTMLYKKGDPGLPENYRSIALVNSITKIFTQIICSRVNRWAEDSNLIPEEQAGFQPGKSCADNIFTLLSLL